MQHITRWKSTLQKLLAEPMHLGAFTLQEQGQTWGLHYHEFVLSEIDL